jgi:serine/threonine-protein kinase
MIGQAIGSYQIVAKLGEGGMGAVYLGEHQHIARKAAIKVLLPQFSANQQIVARFFNEARATSLIRHPGIVEIIDCNILPDGNAYIVMEHLVGKSLGAHLRDQGRLPASRALFLARHIADALSAAHGQRIVHRDLKPDNVFLLTASSETAPIKILDFGIAKLMHTGGAEGSYKTRTGSIMGTPVYMSPEQCRGTGDIDHRTDIYSLGCILFEMLAGRPPFTHEGFGELIQAHLSTEPPRLRSLDASVPAALDALVARLLAKAAGARPQTMGDVIAELDAVLAAATAQGAPAAARASDRPVAALPVARTVPAPAPAPTPAHEPKAPTTTFGSAASEKMDAVASRGGELAPPARSRAPLFAVLTVVAGAAGVAIWLGTRPPTIPLPASPPIAAIAPAPAPATTPTTPASPAPAPSPPAPALAPPAAPTPAAAAAPPAASAPERTPRAASPRKIKIAIASEPSGADVCLARDHLLLGRTNFEWSADKSARPAKLLIRKRGYRGQEITLAPDRDARKQVTLAKLGPDDLDDTDNCERR